MGKQTKITEKELRMAAATLLNGYHQTRLILRETDALIEASGSAPSQFLLDIARCCHKRLNSLLESTMDLEGTARKAKESIDAKSS